MGPQSEFEKETVKFQKSDWRTKRVQAFRTEECEGLEKERRFVSFQIPTPLLHRPTAFHLTFSCLSDRHYEKLLLFPCITFGCQCQRAVQFLWRRRLVQGRSRKTSRVYSTERSPWIILVPRNVCAVPSWFLCQQGLILWGFE